MSDFDSCFEDLDGIKNIQACKLFHYTSHANKEKIVNENSIVFWFTRADRFLDKNEGVQILEPYYYACGALYDKKLIDKEFYLLLREIVKPNDLRQHISNSWIICFSSSGSSKFGKIRYAPNDGWILGFQAGNIGDFCNEVQLNGGMLTLENVCYDREVFQKYFYESLLKVYKKHQDLVLASNGFNQKKFNLCLKKLFTKRIAEYALAYKSVEYRDEEEIRLICTISGKFQSWKNETEDCAICMSGEGKSHHLEIHFRRKEMVFESQELEAGFETSINKSIISAKEIQEVLMSK